MTVLFAPNWLYTAVWAETRQSRPDTFGAKKTVTAGFWPWLSDQSQRFGPWLDLVEKRMSHPIQEDRYLNSNWGLLTGPVP